MLQYQVELGWKEPEQGTNAVDVTGYVVLADGKPVFEVREDNPKLVVDFVKPGEFLWIIQKPAIWFPIQSNSFMRE